jgi:predicted RNase H-like nuclease (RuvC/YqgF family)
MPRQQAPPGGARLTTLAGRIAPPPRREALRAELEAELARVTAENEELAARKLALEKRRPSTVEDEIRVLTLHSEAQAKAKMGNRAGERENAALRKQIAKEKESIARLRKRLTALEGGDRDTVELRLAAFGGDLSVKAALPFMTETIARLESLAAARKATEQHSSAKAQRF